MKKAEYEWYDDFPTEPIGGGNPYSRCVHCQMSVPEINYRLKGHLDYCQYRLEKEEEIALNKRLSDV